MKILFTSLLVWVKSRTLRFFGIVGGAAAVDASFFNGQVGMVVLQLFLAGVNALPFVSMTAEQGISTLVFIIASAGAWLRSITSEGLTEKVKQ